LPAIELTIRNRTADVAVVRDALDRLGVEQGIPAKALIELQVAIDEIISNVIKYAWPDGDPHELQVRMAVGDSVAEVDIIDDGQRYDPRDAPAPAPPRSGIRPPTGGRGVHLVKQLVDRFEYARVGERNHVKLTKQFIVEAFPEGRGPDDKQRT
jgi:anti-sigma regulatory factor (Ser/Thr protein kinase)